MGNAIARPSLLVIFWHQEILQDPPRHEGRCVLELVKPHNLQTLDVGQLVRPTVRRREDNKNQRERFEAEQIEKLNFSQLEDDTIT